MVMSSFHNNNSKNVPKSYFTLMLKKHFKNEFLVNEGRLYSQFLFFCIGALKNL